MDRKVIAKFLKNGWYISIGDRLVLRLDAEHVIKYLKPILKSVIRLRSRFIRVKPDSAFVTFPKGDRLLFRKSDNQLLFFDDDGKWVYRYFSNLNQYDSLKAGYGHLEILYPVNKLEFISPLLTKERLIPGQVLREKSESTQNMIFANLIKGYQYSLINEELVCFTPRITVQDFFDRMEQTYYPVDFKLFLSSHKRQIGELLDTLKWTWNHSDLTPDNIMIFENDYYVVDLEWCEVMPVFYDIANLIYALIFMSNNRTPMHKYFDGEYDDLLKIVLRRGEILSLDRKLLFGVLIGLKGIVAWDAERKSEDIDLLSTRWGSFKEYVAG